jgi:hypothetical protein
MSPSFVESLTHRDLRGIRGVPKSDLHNHFLMGGRLKMLEKFYGMKLQPFRGGSKGIHGINEWIRNVYRPVFEREGAFDKAVEIAFLQARSDGITILEMSLDVSVPKLINIPVSRAISILTGLHQKIAPEIEFRPEMGFPRSLPVRTLLPLSEPFFESGIFKGIDLYDDESAQPVANFREIYRFAKRNGMKCKAHAGEFGDADSVKEAVEVLELDAVQHGIGAAGSVAVMNWLAGHRIPLNVCPASNISLRRVRSYKTHPARILFDHGVKVTINTDDVMLFNKGNSEQYLRLYRSGLFTPGELDQIRLNGLGS